MNILFINWYIFALTIKILCLIRFKSFKDGIYIKVLNLWKRSITSKIKNKVSN